MCRLNGFGLSIVDYVLMMMMMIQIIMKESTLITNEIQSIIIHLHPRTYALNVNVKKNMTHTQ